MSITLSIIIGLFCGTLTGFGIGGGSLLMVFLTAALNIEQINAQSINLIYFLPTAIAAILFHAKNRQVEWHAVLPIAVAGCISAALGACLVGYIAPALLRRIFGAFLLIVGFRILFKKQE